MTEPLAPRLREALGPDYLLERELEGAGMSRVFVATERALGRRVVVKVLPPELSAGVNVERFRREIQLAAQLQHPHIVPLLTAGERGGLLWFTMPFIEGESLRVALERRGPLPVVEVLAILHDVVDALASAHARGVVHRDIKPGNILRSGAHAMVTDFGVAKALSAAIPVTGHTTSGMAIGTPAYMAPEQLAADPAADHRVDVYAAGLLAYELLRGTAPFSGSSPQATLAAQLTERPTPLHVLRHDVPASLSRVVMQCLEKDPDRRPATATALLTLLEEVERQLGGQVATASLAHTRRTLLAAAALFVASATVFAVSRQGADRRAAARSTDAMAAAPAETVVVYRPIPVRDAPDGIALPLVLSPAESTAIVASYRAGAAAPGADDEIDRDSLVAAVSRLFADSMARALARMEAALSASPRQLELQALAREMQAAPAAPAAPGVDATLQLRVDTGAVISPRARAQPPESLRRSAAPDVDPAGPVTPLIPPPSPGTRRLAILDYVDRSRTPALADLGDRLLDSITAQLRTTRGMRLEIIPADATARLLGDTPMRTVTAGFALRAHYVLGGAYFVRNDSLRVITVLTDVQGGDQTRYHEEVIPLGEDAAALAGPTSRWVRARLDSLRRNVAGRAPTLEARPDP
jgi:TolB-like protein